MIQSPGIGWPWRIFGLAAVRDEICGEEFLLSGAAVRRAGQPPARLSRTARIPAFLAAVLFCIGFAAAQAAEEGASAASQAMRSLAEMPVAVTHHTIRMGGRSLAYTAKAGTLEVALENGKARARVFFVEYTADSAGSATRPVTYVFNGGPGAASAYLHLLAFGPRIVALEDDGEIPPAPVRMIDNPSTWLAFTDLVFMDPAGTGFSEAVGDGGEEQAGKANAKPFWSVGRDLDAIAEFMRLHLTRTRRWSALKFVAGESYGGFRAAALSKRLAARPGIRLNGVVLISPVLEFSQLRFSPYRLLPWAGVLPSYVATARYHGKRAADGDLRRTMAEAEAFARGDYLSWLASGAPADGSDVPGRLAHDFGLPRDLIVRHRGRIPRQVFAKQLLRQTGRIISLYDGTISAIDPHPAAAGLHADDPVLDRLTAPLTAAFSRYVRDRLGFKTERPYRVLNPNVSRGWDWASGRGGRQARLGTADRLKEAMTANPALKVFVVHGVYDIVTPYFATKLIVRDMALDPTIRPNLTFRTYEGGHMLYTHAATREALYRDAREFYRSATASD